MATAPFDNRLAATLQRIGTVTTPYVARIATPLKTLGAKLAAPPRHSKSSIKTFDMPSIGSWRVRMPKDDRVPRNYTGYQIGGAWVLEGPEGEILEGPEGLEIEVPPS